MNPAEVTESHACSKDAQGVEQAVQSAALTSAERADAIAALYVRASEAQTPNWDGYGAKPVQSAALQHARAFLLRLPSFIPNPEISIDPDGEVSVDWMLNKDAMLSISISSEGRLSYAATHGTSRAHGVEWTQDEMPPAIAQNLRRLFRERSAWRTLARVACL